MPNILKYDEQKEMQYIEFEGEQRFMGALPTPYKICEMLPRFKDHFALIPRSNWYTYRLRDQFPTVPILDQNGHGSCVGHGACNTFTYSWLSSGNTQHPFSACYVYGNINGGRDQGANVGNALTSMRNRGICTTNEVPANMIYRTQFPSTADQMAARFKIEEGFWCPTFDEMISAILNGYAVCHGIDCGNNYNPGDNGILPDYRSGGGGHCQCGMGVYISSSGKPYCDTDNSWGKRFGLNGTCKIPESYFDRGDHWAIKCTRLDPNDPSNIPVAHE